MKHLFDREVKIILLFLAFLFLLHVPAYFLFSEGKTGILLYSFLLLLCFLTFLLGSVTGLYTSFIYIFIVGSLLFYFHLTSNSNPTNVIMIDLNIFLIYGITLIMLVLIAGKVHEKIVMLGTLNRQLQEENQQFVAIDVDTGFDNKFRMEKEIELEMKRVERYGGSFILLLLQMDHFDDFRRLYGEKETSNLLASLGNKMQHVMRVTDRKFRYEKDRFALILTHTDQVSIEVIYDKLAKFITTHQLLNQKYITITFRSGHIIYNQKSKRQDHQELFEIVESEMISREL